MGNPTRWLLLLLSGLLILAACELDPTVIPTPKIEQELARRPTQRPMLIGGEVPILTPAMVTRVIDGDTIEVSMDDKTYTVRYTGVDTPETVHPSRPVECYGPEASQRNHELVEGRTVFLEKDVSETDRFGRLLRYVWLEDGRLLNEVLVAEGYAQVSTYPPDVKYVDRFLEAQAQAVEDGTGLWGQCTEQAPRESPDAGNYDPAYPTVCIPPPPPYLDCGDVVYRRFTVLAPDPHGFDGDRDGIGCES